MLSSRPPRPRRRPIPSCVIEQFGGASAGKAVQKLFADDLHKAETISLPVTLIILLVRLRRARRRRPAAAARPHRRARHDGRSSRGVSQFAPVDRQPDRRVVLLVGLAVGVDYSLFYIRREREERKAGRSPEAALEAAAATSGRAVLVSGFTVMAAMAGMYLAGDNGLQLDGDRHDPRRRRRDDRLAHRPAGDARRSSATSVDRGRIPFLGKRLAAPRASRASGPGSLDRVLKRPLAAALISGGLLVALSIPALRPAHRATPARTPSRRTRRS